MKAKRRHDLQTNTLAKVITGAPSWWSEYGGKTLFVFVVALLIGFLIRYRISSARETAMHAAQELASARSLIDELRQRDPRPGVPIEAIMSSRRQLAAEANASIDNAIGETREKRIKAEALVARGDVNWLLASFPDIPGGATQPSLRNPKDRNEYLAAAAEAYQSVLDNYADQKDAAIAAHFGLAAIAEDASDWASAQKHYESIANDADAPASYQTLARIRLDYLTMIKRPVLLATPTTQTTTAPAATTTATRATTTTQR